jgi:hypothetical protein
MALDKLPPLEILDPLEEVIKRAESIYSKPASKLRYIKELMPDTTDHEIAVVYAKIAKDRVEYLKMKNN